MARLSVTPVQFPGVPLVHVLDCAHCGVVFALDDLTIRERRRSGLGFFCPNGHSNVFRIAETSDERARREEREALERRIAQAESRATSAETGRKWAESALKGARIQEGKAKAAARRLLHRVTCGVCPQCQRSFKQLRRHMAAKHGAKS